jgi:ankyrin repeat protein
MLGYGLKYAFFISAQDGETALNVAVRKGNYDVVKVLLDNNADFMKQSIKVCSNMYIHNQGSGKLHLGNTLNLRTSRENLDTLQFYWTSFNETCIQ